MQAAKQIVATVFVWFEFKSRVNMDIYVSESFDILLSLLWFDCHRELWCQMRYKTSLVLNVFKSSVSFDSDEWPVSVSYLINKEIQVYSFFSQAHKCTSL